MRTSNAAMGVALLILGFIWGSSFILMKLALFDTQGDPLFPALDVAMGRIAIAGLALLPVAWIQRRHLNHATLPWLVLVGGVGNLLPAYFFTTAQTLIPSSVAGMLNALTPMFTFVVGVVLFGTRTKRLQVWGLVVGLIGAAVLAFQPGMGATLAPDMAWGAGRVVLATACYGLSVNLIRNKLGHVPPAAVAASPTTPAAAAGAKWASKCYPRPPLRRLRTASRGLRATHEHERIASDQAWTPLAAGATRARSA